MDRPTWPVVEEKEVRVDVALALVVDAAQAVAAATAALSAKEIKVASPTTSAPLTLAPVPSVPQERTHNNRVLAQV